MKKEKNTVLKMNGMRFNDVSVLRSTNVGRKLMAAVGTAVGNETLYVSITADDILSKDDERILFASEIVERIKKVSGQQRLIDGSTLAFSKKHFETATGIKKKELEKLIAVKPDTGIAMLDKYIEQYGKMPSESKMKKFMKENDSTGLMIVNTAYKEMFPNGIEAIKPSYIFTSVEVDVTVKEDIYKNEKPKRIATHLAKAIGYKVPKYILSQLTGIKSSDIEDYAIAKTVNYRSFCEALTASMANFYGKNFTYEEIHPAFGRYRIDFKFGNVVFEITNWTGGKNYEANITKKAQISETIGLDFRPHKIQSKSLEGLFDKITSLFIEDGIISSKEAKKYKDFQAYLCKQVALKQQ